MRPDIKRILVPLDFSVNSHRALEYAHTLARSVDATLHLVHVCEAPAQSTPAMDANGVGYCEWNQIGEEAELNLLRYAAPIRDVNVTTGAVFGQVAYGIVDAASVYDADLIVMGIHGHGALMHRLTIPERVARTTSCPVLIVREPKPNIETARDDGRLATVLAEDLAPPLPC